MTSCFLLLGALRVSYFENVVRIGRLAIEEVGRMFLSCGIWALAAIVSSWTDDDAKKIAEFEFLVGVFIPLSLLHLLTFWGIKRNVNKILGDKVKISGSG